MQATVVSRHRIGVSSHGSFQRTEYADVERLSDVRGMGRKHHEVNGVRDAESDEFGFDMTAVAVDNKKTSCNIADSRTWLEYVLEPFVCKDVVRPTGIGCCPPPSLHAEDTVR